MDEPVRSSNARILVVDDNPGVRNLLREVLGAEGHEVDLAADGPDALARAAAVRPDLVLLDLDLPGLDGYEVCRRLKRDPATRLVPVVIITAQGEFSNRLAAWEFGADEFLTKPFQVVEVTARCRSLLRIKRLIDERDSAEAVVFALARAVEAKSPYTHGHSERVTRYALALAEDVGLRADDREVLRKGALLHDIGKISVPDAVLNKPGALTPDEYAVVRDHTLQGAHIVEPLATLRDLVPFIRWHHERPDGRGYPDGLAGDAIPLPVRVLSVADVYDSLASERPYRGRVPHAKCLEMLRELALNGGLDPELVAHFCGRVRPEPAAATAAGPAAEVAPPHHKDVILYPPAGGVGTRPG
jgi:putative two-component system response regulator